MGNFFFILIVNLMNQECDEFLARIAIQKRETDEQQKSVAATTILIREEEAECLKIKDSAEADLQEAMPALQEAMQVSVIKDLFCCSLFCC